MAEDCAPSGVIESGTEVLDDILCRDTSPSTVIETDCPNLNRKLGGGFRTGKLILGGGRFGKGKTAFGCQSVASAIRQGFKALTISMEMSSAEMYQRIVSAECGIPMSAWKRALNQSETQLIREYRDTTKNAVWRIDDRPTQSVRTIHNVAKLMKLREGLDFILIDNLQLLQFEGDPKTQDALQLTQISKRLKLMSRDLDVAIMLLCQLDTDAGKPGAIPNSTSWARSKAIEGDADIALMLHQVSEEKPSEYLLICTKFRDSPKFTIPLRFEGLYQRFSDPEPATKSGYSVAEDFQ